MVGIRSQAAHVIGADEKHGTDGQGAVVRAVQDQLGHLVAQFRIHGRKGRATLRRGDAARGIAGAVVSQGRTHLVQGKAGDVLAHQGLGRDTFQDAVGFALGITADDAAGRIGRVAGDARDLQGLAVGNARMARHMAEKDGNVRRDFIQDLSGGITLLLHAFLVEAVPDDPLGRTVVMQLAAQALLEGFHVLHSTVGCIQAVHAAAAKMTVPIDESRQQRAPFQRDQVGVIAHSLLHILQGARGHYTPVHHGQCFDLGEVRIHGQDGTVMVNGDLMVCHWETPVDFLVCIKQRLCHKNNKQYFQYVKK